MPNQPLHGRVAVVAGATRGAGRGIARMLGAAGATVYCTGRSVRGHAATADRPETIDETAQMVTAEGGRGVAVRTDHTVESEVEQLFARIRSEQDRLDVLINDVWGGDALTEWGSPFCVLPQEFCRENNRILAAQSRTDIRRRQDKTESVAGSAGSTTIPTRFPAASNSGRQARVPQRIGDETARDGQARDAGR